MIHPSHIVVSTDLNLNQKLGKNQRMFLIFITFQIIKFEDDQRCSQAAPPGPSSCVSADNG